LIYKWRRYDEIELSAVSRIVDELES
jgi:hypothetical protein